MAGQPKTGQAQPAARFAFAARSGYVPGAFSRHAGIPTLAPEINHMKHVTLQTQLYMRLLALLLGIGLLFGFSLNHYLRVLLETEVADKSDMIFANVLAMQTYVRETLRPIMYDTLPVDSFVLEAMSTSYVTRKVMSDLNASKDKFTYRRVALDPRNPEYGANQMERGFIDGFQKNPEETRTQRFFNDKGQEFFIMARAVIFDDSCLACHGKPSDAPKVLLAKYGANRGFGRFAGEIGGLDAIIMPVENEAREIRGVLVGFTVVFGCGVLLILGANHIFFDRLTVANIGRLATLMRERFPAEAGHTLDNMPRRGQDEIEGMVKDMERFADHLRDAKEQLKDYAHNLEERVEQRTAQATREAQARSADVRLFLHVLELFVQDAGRTKLLEEALKAFAHRFEALSASFCCFYSMNSHTWPANAPCPPLSGPVHHDLLEGREVFDGTMAHIPVEAGNTVRGALTLCWPEPPSLPLQEREVLQAVGRQLGIALENLEVMENLLRRKTVLESIFEGIADPLFLLSGAGEVLHANESAAHLQAGLGGQKDPLGFAALAAEASQAPGTAISREVLLSDGRSFTLRAYPLDSVPGPGLGATQGRAIVYARDNTGEKTIMARLQQGEKSLAIGQLAAGMAHEINNPLGVILCYARLLWDDGLSPHAADVDIIIRYTLQAQKVLEDLLRFARPKPEALGALHLADTAEFIARVFTGKAGRAGMRIDTDIPPGLPMVWANASALEQILTNLVLNAMDAFAPEASGPGEHPADIQGRVLISARYDAQAGEVALSVRDNGPGIPPEHLSRLFDPFFTTKNVGKGTGLGLSVVYGLVRGLGGQIEADNDSGAVFTIRLKAMREDSDA